MRPAELVSSPSCTGCFACVDVCPVKALAPATDAVGFGRPGLDEQKCVSCNRCVTICPAHTPNAENSREPDTYAFVADDETRARASSGGAFPIIAEAFLAAGGKVVGAAWDAQFNARLVLIDHVASLPRLSKSKYVRSFTDDIYRKVKAELKNGTKILFSGLPCQIAGLYAVLGGGARKSPDLFTVDILCAQAPSNLYWQKYLTETFGGPENILEYEFRNKDHRGSTTKVRLKNGETRYFHNTNDLWNRLYHGRHLSPDACCDCRFGLLPRQGDITIGDFWQLGDFDNSLVDEKGVSVFLVNNPKGALLLEALKKAPKAALQKTPLEWACKKNRVNWRPVAPSPQRDSLLKLAQRLPLLEAEKRAMGGRHGFDIGLVAHFRNRNYGGSLTAYALYQLVRALGYDALCVDAVPRWCADFSPFRTYSYPKTATFFDYAKRFELCELNKICDRFLVGSDQLFCSAWLFSLQKIPALNWVAGAKKKAGYAISFGISTFHADEEAVVALSNDLSLFDSISTREFSGRTLLAEKFGISTAEWVLDPVFLLPEKEWAALAKNAVPVIPEGGVFGYIMYGMLNAEKLEFFEKLSKDLGLPSRALGDRSNTKENGSPVIDEISDDTVFSDDWLASIIRAKLVVTDSFHGVCFSIILKKPFILALPDKTRSYDRFETLLSLLSLQDRVCASFSDYEKLRDDGKLFNVDWTAVGGILEKERKRSMEFLAKACHPERKASAEKTAAGELRSALEKNAAIQKEKEELTARLDRLEKENQSQLEKFSREKEDLTTRLSVVSNENSRYQRMASDPVILFYQKVRKTLKF
jgi:coenzyme F420-reducing hydrogenase beta subunit